MDRKVSKLGKSWETFHGPNLGYVMDMYEVYKDNPDEVEEDLKAWFDAYGAPTMDETTNGVSVMDSQEVNSSSMHKVAAAIKLADNIRTFGHLLADMNPLQEPGEESSFLDPKEHGLSEDDLKSMPAEMLCKDAPNTVRNGLDAINHLKQMYTKSIAFEFHHVHDLEEKNWLNQMVETGNIYEELSSDKRKSILEKLTATESFEQFLHRYFVGQKRFSIEGLDAMVPMLEEMTQSYMQDGARDIMIGMAHRGRLSTLAHVLGKPYHLIFSEFKHAPNEEEAPTEGSLSEGWTGDVKYHLGLISKLVKNQHIQRLH